MTKNPVKTFVLVILVFCLDIQAGDKPLVRFGVQEGMVKSSGDSGTIFWTHGVVKEVFEREGYRVEIIELPNRRLPFSLKNDRIDCLVAHAHGVKGYYFQNSAFPVYQVTFYIYYDHRRDWTPVWPPDEIFRQKRGKSKNSSAILSEQFKLNVFWAKDYDEGVKLVNHNRIDYWLENAAGLAFIDFSKIKKKEEGFTLKPIYQKYINAWFQESSNGHKLKLVFNKGLAKVLRKGELAQVFYKGAPGRHDLNSINQTVEYINKQFPLEKFPKQKPVEKDVDLSEKDGSGK